MMINVDNELLTWVEEFNDKAEAAFKAFDMVESKLNYNRAEALCYSVINGEINRIKEARMEQER